ncbi:MAG: alpha/beta hydrolase [Hyphomicrobiales bacterium]
MPTFLSDGDEIAYREAGEGPPVLLIHGFGSNIDVNWGDTGWISTLASAGHRVIALDNRGHGASAKLYDKEAYAAPTMAEDARRLLDHLEIAEADVMGYSMGARISAFLAIEHPSRVRRLVLAGLAANMIEGVQGGEAIARALEAESLADVTGAEPRAFRKFAEQTRSDMKALAACMRSSREKIDREALARIRCPVLVVAGELDDIAGPVAPLVDAIPNAKGVVLPRRNHMNAVGDREYKAAVVAFLG